MQNAPGGQAEARKSLQVPEFIFVNWREMLNQEPLAVPARRAYVQAIEAYLDYCRNNGVSVRVETAKGFLSDAERRGVTREPGMWRNSLRWYFHEGRKRGKPQPPGVPSLGQADTGRTMWETRLIERLRLKKYRV